MSGSDRETTGYDPARIAGIGGYAAIYEVIAVWTHDWGLILAALAASIVTEGGVYLVARYIINRREAHHGQ